MILLDTHIWVWWVHRDEHLPARLQTFIERHESATLGVSAISCWEVSVGAQNRPVIGAR